jgi:putative oxidoreductase
MTDFSDIHPLPRTWTALNVFLWILQILLAAMFLMVGSRKLMGTPDMVGAFEKIGMGQWFRYVTGGLEVIGAIGLLIPRTSGLAGLLLICVMAGAVITHLAVLGGSPALPAGLLVAAIVIAWGRRDRIAALLKS